MILAGALLMVAQNSHLPIRMVVRLEFLSDALIRRSVLVQESLEGDRGVVGTEDFGGEALHVRE